nr:uncharacterized protein LOC100353727 isoform X4 [Oryctolagus cuniculus]XP_051689645.1 uncharacterized protein LOC100353727 isoform X4 [Oryctolagus cuniculus]XP_051689646.1 uncharacterized protein LOC100353727 isoform X4 [Oryctolagus cuniculus]
MHCDPLNESSISQFPCFTTAVCKQDQLFRRTASASTKPASEQNQEEEERWNIYRLEISQERSRGEKEAVFHSEKSPGPPP